MSSYISSNANRFYVALETAYGQASTISASNRYPAVKLIAHQALEMSRRRDKTGTRTFLGTPNTARRATVFETHTYLTSWNGLGTPSYGPLFQAALGAAPVANQGLLVGQVLTPTSFQTTSPHGLMRGNGLTVNNELRFVSSVTDPLTISLNAPFSSALTPGTSFASAVTYSLANNLPSVTLFDYWDPVTAVQRLITGATVDRFDLSVNGDFHEFMFRGPAVDIVDSGTFLNGSAGLTQYPAEPVLGAFDYSLIPGHLGQAWIGNSGNQTLTLTGAKLELKNNLHLRNREFGATLPRSIAAGGRQIAMSFSLLVQDDVVTTALYQASRSRTPVPVMLQLGQRQGQLMGIYMPALVPEMPEFDDGGDRLQWDFNNCLAQGRNNDELFICFG